MNSREEKDNLSRSAPRGALESPFLAGELFVGEAEPAWGARLAALEAESPFRSAFEEGSTSPMAAEAQEEEFVGEEEWGETEGFEAEAYGEGALAEPEESQELYYEEEAPYEEGETDDEKPLPRMKFEIQTQNRIWRNDGTTATLLERKYGPKDFLVDKKGVRLESETNGVLEFETEWFRSWPKLEEALKKAVKMTDDMNKAAAAKFEKSRKAFPFDVAHLRTGTPKEIQRGFWNPDNYRGYENRHWNKNTNKYELERILGAGEELEVETVDSAWKAGIQSSESFLLEYYESFLRQHEWPFFRDGTIKHAKAILDGANTGGLHATEVAKLRSFLQIIVNYIMRGQGGTESAAAGAFADVKGLPAKQAFTLMSRTNFASMYKVLLTDKEKRLFEKIVKNDLVLKEMGLDRKSPVFIKGYGTEAHEPGPTVYQWLSGIIRGVDLLSARSGKSLSAAMGRYNVETRKGKKDRGLVKFETRNTVLGAVGIKATDWVKYAQKLFDKASKRESDALGLLQQQGVADESKLANFVFFARHPELGGRRIRQSERALAQEWLRIRDDMVRPLLQGVQPEMEEFEGTEELESLEEEAYYETDTGVGGDFVREQNISDEEEEFEFDVTVQGFATNDYPLQEAANEEGGEFEWEPETEELETASLPRGLKLSEHYHTPKSLPGGSVGAPRRMVQQDMNPGFVSLITDDILFDRRRDGLQTHLEHLIRTKYARFLATRSSAQERARQDDRIRVALVDLTGRKRFEPDIAGWGSTLPVDGASVPKICALYAVHQLRSDLNNLADKNKTTKKEDLIKAAKAFWQKAGFSSMPRIDDLFMFVATDHLSRPVSVTFSAGLKETLTKAFKDNDNCAVDQLIAQLGFPYIASVMWQSGLRHPTRGGLWLWGGYCCTNKERIKNLLNPDTIAIKCKAGTTEGLSFRWKSNPVQQPKPVFAHNATALSVVTYFTLLAQGRLVDDRASSEIAKTLQDACSFFWESSHLLGGLSLDPPPTKCGVVGRLRHDGILIKRTEGGKEISYAAAAFTIGAGDFPFGDLLKDLDKLIRDKN